MRADAILLSTFILYSLLTAQEVKIGDVWDGNRSRDVHTIRLIDHDSSTIWIDEQPLMPFSTKNTCGDCHDYNKIATGWHFNAGMKHNSGGRPGQPWIYSDPSCLTQLPLSYRSWPGSSNPDTIGITPFDFIKIFGRHAPGGGIGDDEIRWEKNHLIRWRISGPFEVNCLSCHDKESAYDHSEYANQMLRQNYRWAPTAASSIAVVTGSARDMPDNYDIYRGTAPDEAQKQPPKVFYNVTRFNPQNKVFFDITTQIPDDNCYFCHSQVIAETPTVKTEDVHLKAGIGCVDCHSNGLDHMIDRGYGGLENSCRNCHYQTGLFGAPKPEHPGLPPLHLTKLACTACHSGPKPEINTRPFKTSMAHALGVHGINKSPKVLPHIEGPVYGLNESGVLIPQYLMWPSFWGESEGDRILPLNPLHIQKLVRNVIRYDDSLATGSWLPVTDSVIYEVLDTLALSQIAIKEPVFVAQGKVYRRDGGGLLGEMQLKTAEPVMWPMAHDVRPAVQSLGSEGCIECHSNSAPFFFGQIRIDGPLDINKSNILTMSEFQNKSSLQRKIFAASFIFRPWLKGFLIGSTIMAIFVLLLYGTRAISAIIRFIQREEL